MARRADAWRDLEQIEAMLLGLGDEDEGVVQKIERLLKLRENINAADVVILLGKKGHSGSARFKGMSNEVPFKVDVHYGEKDDPPLTIRKVTVAAGWSAKDWRNMDRSALHEEGDGG